MTGPAAAAANRLNPHKYGTPAKQKLAGVQKLNAYAALIEPDDPHRPVEANLPRRRFADNHPASQQTVTL